MWNKFVFVCALLVGSIAGASEIRVVATVSNLGMLAREIGGDAVEVQVLAPPNRNPHYLDARPSMMAALRRADIVVAVGAELEIGWLPAALRGSNNPRVQTGQRGYFEAARKVTLIHTDRRADRALGDVHPMGNPHVYMDPERMITIAQALAERFSELQRDKEEIFTANAARFEEALKMHMPAWRDAARNSPGVVLYHEDGDYLLHYLEVPVLGYIEPLPGIPPTARHLRNLVKRLSGSEGVVWTMNFQPATGSAHVARELGWPMAQLPCQVTVNGSVDDYIAMIYAWVNSLSSKE